MSDEPHYTMPLDDFRKMYDADDNEWWRLQGGDQQNLFDAAVMRLENVEAVIAEMEEHVVKHSGEWFYLVKLQQALERPVQCRADREP